MRRIAPLQCSALNRMEETAIQTERWLTKDEAAEILRISPRRVLEYVQVGALVSQTIRDPKTNQMTKQISAADVARLREERENPKPQASQTSQVVATQSGAIVRKPAGRPPSQAIALRDRTEPQPSAFNNWPPPLYLTLEQAIQYTGLSEAELRRCAKGAPRGPRGALVYRRKDIEAL